MTFLYEAVSKYEMHVARSVSAYSLYLVNIKHSFQSKRVSKRNGMFPPSILLVDHLVLDRVGESGFSVFV